LGGGKCSWSVKNSTYYIQNVSTSFFKHIFKRGINFSIILYIVWSSEVNPFST
jgi:hypothetical protein